MADAGTIRKPTVGTLTRADLSDIVHREIGLSRADSAGTLRAFLDEVDREYGGPHGLAMSVGVDEEAIARLGVRLVGTSPLAR